MKRALPILVVLTVSAAPAQERADRPRTFEAYVWRESNTPAPDAARVLAAIGGTLAIGGEPRAELDAELLLFNAPGRNDLHLEREREGYAERWRRWYDTRDDALLVRVPCLTDPATVERLERTLDVNLRADSADLRGISIGDEVGLTPHAAPEDVCLSPTCRAAWRQWLAARPDLDEESRARLADPAAFSTDATRLAFADGDTEALFGWLLRRHFHEEVVRRRVAALAARARERAPRVPIGLLGLGAPSPFGTPRSERLFSELDFIEAYREVDARELVLTAREDQRVLLTVFPERGRPAAAAWSIWEHWLRGGDGVVLWSDRTLAADEALLARLVRTLEDVRAAAPGFRPRPAGVAVLHDFDSLAANWLRDALLDGPTWPRRLATHQVATGTWERGLCGWLALLEDCGLQPGALDLEAVDAHTVERFGVLVASELDVLDTDDLERLGGFVAAGGRLWISGAFGRLDARGRRAASSAFEHLARVAPERVLRIEEDLGDYPFERARRTPRARAWRAALNERLDTATVPRPPWHLQPTLEDLPWLSAWSVDSEGVVTATALPNTLNIHASGGLTDLAVEVRPREGYDLEWLHPSEEIEGGARLLRAGDAAVFRLRPR